MGRKKLLAVDGSIETIAPAKKRRRKGVPDRQAFSDAENDTLRKAVDVIVDTYGSQVKAAEVLEVTQGYVSSFLKKRHGAGSGFGRKVAEATGTTLSSLLGWNDSGPAAPFLENDRYPNRARAVAAARIFQFSEIAINQVKKLEWQEGAVDPSCMWWLAQIEAVHNAAFAVEPPRMRSGRLHARAPLRTR